MSTNRTCPRCSGELRHGHYEELDVHVCADCKGLLARQMDLIRLLESVARVTAANDDPNAAIEPIPDKGAGLACPLCSRTMDNYGYMGSKNVKIDGCLPCQAVWIDTDELGVMSLMHARSKRPVRTEYMESHPSRLVDTAFLVRSVEGVLFGGFVVWD